MAPRGQRRPGDRYPRPRRKVKKTPKPKSGGGKGCAVFLLGTALGLTALAAALATVSPS